MIIVKSELLNQTFPVGDIILSWAIKDALESYWTFKELQKYEHVILLRAIEIATSLTYK